MKKMLVVVGFISVLFFSGTALAWDDCPYSEVDCSYPGECSRYIDTDNDGICDHSQAAPEDRETTIVKETEDQIASTKVADGDDLDEKSVVLSEENKDKNKKNSISTNYYFVPISIIIILLYFLSFILYKTKKMSFVVHKKIWNVLLLITFLISAILGLLLVIRIQFGLVMNPPIDVLFWHVVAGIPMAIISIFHVLWHLNYYKLIFKGRSRSTL